MRAGRLRHPIDITQRSVAESGGLPVETWSTVHHLFAERTAREGSESNQDGIAKNTRRVTFLVRYRSDITAGMRVSADDGVYNIIDPVDPTGRRRELQLICERVTDQGMGDPADLTPVLLQPGAGGSYPMLIYIEYGVVQIPQPFSDLREQRDRLVFDRAVLAAIPYTLQRGDQIVAASQTWRLDGGGRPDDMIYDDRTIKALARVVS